MFEYLQTQSKERLFVSVLMNLCFNSFKNFFLDIINDGLKKRLALNYSQKGCVKARKKWITNSHLFVRYLTINKSMSTNLR